MSTFKVTCRKVAKATCYKSALYEIEYAPGCTTNVYAADRAEALAKVAS